jgi:hypothetical protein
LISKDENLKDLILHPVIRSLVDVKWQRLNIFIYLNVFFYFIMLWSLGVFVTVYFKEDVYHPPSDFPLMPKVAGNLKFLMETALNLSQVKNVTMPNDDDVITCTKIIKMKGELMSKTNSTLFDEAYSNCKKFEFQCRRKYSCVQAMRAYQSFVNVLNFKKPQTLLELDKKHGNGSNMLKPDNNSLSLSNYMLQNLKFISGCKFVGLPAYPTPSDKPIRRRRIHTTTDVSNMFTTNKRINTVCNDYISNLESIANTDCEWFGFFF